MRISSKEFEDWCLSKESSGLKADFNLEMFLNRRIKETNQAAATAHISSLVQAIVDESKSQNVNLSGTGGVTLQNDELAFALSFHHRVPLAKDGVSETPINFFSVTDSRVSVEVIGAVIRQASVSTNKVIFFRNCNICGLYLLGGIPRVRLEECNIGTLTVHQNYPVGLLEVRDCAIHVVDCPVPGKGNPFGGHVAFVNVKFPTSVEESKLFKNKQHFHNLRHHLEELENTFEAQKMRALELAAERKDEAFTNRVLSWYQYLSTNYGLNPGRPLLVAFALYLLMVFLTFVFGWAELEARVPKEFYDTAWRAKLKDAYENCLWIWGTAQQCGNWARAWLLPGQYILNPFGIFGTQSLLVAKSGWINVVLTFSGLFCDVLIATSFLAIRKRFKLN